MYFLSGFCEYFGLNGQKKVNETSSELCCAVLCFACCDVVIYKGHPLNNSFRSVLHYILHIILLYKYSPEEEYLSWSQGEWFSYAYILYIYISNISFQNKKKVVIRIRLKCHCQVLWRWCREIIHTFQRNYI